MSELRRVVRERRTRWDELASPFETDADATLPDASDVLDELLASDIYAGHDDLRASIRTAQAVARIERGEEPARTTSAQASEDLRSVRRALAAPDAS